MMKASKLPVSLILLFVSSIFGFKNQLVAQRAYYEVEMSTEFWDSLSFSLKPELRYDGDLHQTDSLVDLSLGYDFLKYFTVGFTYRRGEEWDKHDIRYDYERFAYDLSFNDELGPIEYDVRVRYTHGDDPEDDLTRNFLRYRLKVATDKSYWGLKPYVGFEFYQDADTGDHERNVYFAGIKYKLRKSLKLNFEYKQVTKLQSTKDYDAIVVSLGYEF